MRQRGFIQNFIIPGIVLIGVVLAGIAMLASNAGSSDTSNEKAAMLANSIIGTGLTISGAIQRAEADGAQFAAVAALDSASTLVTGKYMTAVPTLPRGLTPPYFVPAPYADKFIYEKGVAQVESAGVPAGTTAADDIIVAYLGMDATAAAVCDRINNKIAGTPTGPAFRAVMEGDVEPVIRGKAAVAGVAEGCTSQAFDTETLFIYYKVVNAK